MKKAFRTPLSDTSVNVNKSEKLNEAAQTSKEQSKVPRSMSDAEYEEIFAAVLQRYAATDENASNGGDTKYGEAEVQVKDDFDEVLQEEDQVTEEEAKEKECCNSGICEEEMKTEETAEDNTSTSKTRLFPVGSPCMMKNSKICSSKPKACELVETRTKMREMSEKKQKNVLPSVTRTPQSACHKNKERTEVKTASMKVSRKEKMQNRVIEETGTWVQCCESSCLKWRYLADVTDPAKLPEFWTCFLNKDSDYDSCDKPEQEFNQAEHDENYLFTKYTEGSVVWAKMIGFPWWPAMIEVDPDYDVFCECRDNTQTVSHYHVVFFDEKVSRAWIRSDDISRFSSCESFDVMGPYKVGKCNYRSAVARAWEKAIIAATLPIKERLARYSFSVRFNGKWGIDGSDDSKALEKLKSKGPHKRSRRQRAAGLDVEMNGDMSMTEEEMCQILDNAEAIIQNTEDVLEEFFTGSSQNNDSDFLPELESPVRKKPKMKTTKSKEEEKPLQSGKKQKTESQKGKNIGKKDVKNRKSQSKPAECKIPAFKAPRSSLKKDAPNPAVCKEFLTEFDSDVYTMEMDGEVLEHGDTPQLLAEDVTDYFKKELGRKELDDGNGGTNGESIEMGERKTPEGKTNGDIKENMTEDGGQEISDSGDQENVKDTEKKEESDTEGMKDAEGKDAKEDTVEDIEDTKEVNTDETTQKKVITLEEGKKEKDKTGSQECFIDKSDGQVLDEKTVEDVVQSKNRAPRNKTKPPQKKKLNANNDKKRETPKYGKSKVSSDKSNKENNVINTDHGPDIQRNDADQDSGQQENAYNCKDKALKPVLSSQENKSVTKEMETKRGAKKAKFAAPVAKNEIKSAYQDDMKGQGRSKNEIFHQNLSQDESRPDSEKGPQTPRGVKPKRGIKRKASFVEEEREDDELNLDVEVEIIQEESNKNASQKLEEKADSDFDFEE